MLFNSKGLDSFPGWTHVYHMYITDNFFQVRVNPDRLNKAWSRCRITWKRKGVTGRPQKLGKSAFHHLLSWLHTKALPLLRLSQKYIPSIPCRDLCLWIGNNFSQAVRWTYWPFLPKDNLIHPWKETWAAMCSLMPHHASQVVNG